MLSMGMLLFALVHFIPSMTPALKTAAVGRLGENGYKGIFSLLLLVAFALIILGWRSVLPEGIYTPPAELHKIALALLAFAFLLLVVTSRKSRLRRIIRHPQLTGVAVWGFAHLLLNGDNRSVVLFGGMLLWALIEIIVISKREGVWIKTEPPSRGTEAVTVLIAGVTVAVVIVIHPWLSGVAVW
jgi:uncharacterized membrane protein